MIEKGFSSPRSDAFPAGLHVLVVDDDPTWLKILEKMLKKCSYEVTTCCLAREALSLLRERKDGYDIIISDVNMPDMDGFKLLEHVGLEMDLPVIMMSVDGETSRVMKGVQHGACDYLLKPIRMKELRNIWQHVLRKKIHEVREIESYEGVEVLQLMRHGSDQSEDSLFLSGEDFGSVKKRKDVDGKHDDFGDSSSSKKPRVVWTVELHQKFVEAVNEIGFEKVGPKRILDSMKVPWLTRENVASHLQKYRLYLSRLQKENDLKLSFCGTKHSDLPLNDTTKKISIQNSTNPHQNEASSAIFLFPGNKLLIDAKTQEGDSEGIASMPVIESKRTLLGNAELGFSNSLVFDSTNPTQYGWGEVPEIEFKQEHEPLLQLKDSFSPPQVEHKPLYDEFRNNLVDYSQIPSKTHLANHQTFETISPRTLGTKNESCNLNIITDLEDASAFESFNEDLQFSWLQGDDYAKNLALENIEFSEENNPGLLGEVPLHLYDALRFDYEYACDPVIF